MNNIINALQKRYATKKFNVDFKLSAEQEQQIQDIIRLTPSSMGIQPYEVVFVKEPGLKKSLMAAAYNQGQVESSAMTIVFAIGDPIEKGWFDRQAELLIKERHMPREKAESYMNGFKSSFEGMSKAARLEWAGRQAYIALGSLLTSLAMEGLDACPMEGFDRATFDDILNLGERGLTSLVILTVGQRSPEDQTQYEAKVRKSSRELFSYALSQTPEWN